MSQRTVLRDAKEVMEGRRVALGIAAALVRGSGLSDDTPEYVYEWARICGMKLADALDGQVRSVELDGPEERNA